MIYQRKKIINEEGVIKKECVTGLELHGYRCAESDKIEHDEYSGIQKREPSLPVWMGCEILLPKGP